MAFTTLAVTFLAVRGTPGWAQMGWYLVPSIGLTEEFDDNVFGEPSGQRSDFITRFSPKLLAGYRSTRFTIEGSYTFDAEVYVKNPDLSTEAARELAVLDVQYLPTRRMTLGLRASYFETETATDLFPETGRQLGRLDASLFGASSSIAYRFTPRDTGSFTYGVSVFEIGAVRDVRTDPITTHAALAGWTRRTGERTTLTLQAGARAADGEIGPEASVRLEHRLRLVRVSVSYERSDATVVGREGTGSTEVLLGSVVWDVLRSLEVNSGIAVRRVSGVQGQNGAALMVYGLTASAVYRATRWLSARAAYQFTYQDGRPDDIQRNVFSIGLDFSYPVR